MTEKETAFTFDRKRFSKLLERVATDDEFGARLDKKPLLTLMESGFDLRRDIAREIEDKTLSEIIQFDPIGPKATTCPFVVIGVSVGVAVGTRVKGDVVPDERIQPAIRDRVLDIVDERVEMMKLVFREPSL